MSSPAANPLIGGCLALFGLPFFAGGVLLLVAAMGSAPRDAEPGSTPVMALVGVLFVVIGGAMIAVAARAVRAGKREIELRREFPEQPWRWRDAWADGLIAPSGRSGAALLWVFAVVWCGISAGAAYGLWATPRGAEAPLLIRVIFGIGFPLIGVVVLIAAVSRSLQIARFGRPRLHLLTMPGALGGWLRARVECALPPAEESPFAVRVRCLRQVTTRHRKEQSTEDITVWSAEQVVAGQPADELAGGSRIDVVQALPADGTPTDETVRWEVEISCDRPGLDFSETWEIPVFAVAGVETAVLPPGPPPQVLPPRPPRRVRIEDEGTAVVIRFPAALNPGLSLTGLMLAGFGTVAAYVAWHEGWRIGAGLIALPTLLCARAALRGWLQTTVLHARSDGVEIATGLLGLTLSRRTIPRERIAAVRLHTDLTAGNTKYPRLEMAGRRIGPYIPGAAPAEAVRRAVARGLGLEP